MRVLPAVIESTTARTPQHGLLPVLLVQAFAGGTGELLSKSTIIVVEILHLPFELSTFRLVRPQQLLHLTTLLVVHFVQVDLAHRVEGNRRGDLLLQEVLVCILAEPRMSQNLLNAVDGSQSLLGVLAEQTSQ